LGVSSTFPPTSVTGGGYFDYGEKGKWKLIEEDIVKFGKVKADATITKLVWAAKGENVGVYVDKIGLFLYGGKGERVVVYVDDIRVEGEVPTEETYKEEIKRRWAPVKEGIEQKISSWETTLQEKEKELNSLANLSPEAEKMKKEGEKKILSLKEKIKIVEGIVEGRGFINPSEREEIDPSLEQLKYIISNIKAISEGKIKSKDILIYVVSPINSLKVLPFDTFIPGEISDEIRMIATPGEYEPGSFVVSAISDITSLKVEATDLKGEKGIIPSSNVDIKLVKCWYQAGTAWYGSVQDKSKRVLVPELLLNDDTLIKVDYKEEKNYLKLNFPEGEKYIWISNPDEPGGNDKILSVEDYPVKDASTLLPIDIPAKTNKQFWLTIKVPEDSRAGIYQGKITLSSFKEDLATITLKLKVLPFKLASPKTYYNLKENFISSIYYPGRIHPNYPKGTISSEMKSKEQLRAELKDMFIHGITNPFCFQRFDKKELLGEYLTIREEVGMGSQPLYFLGKEKNLGFGVPTEPAKLELLKERVKEILKFAKEFNIPEVYFYGIDEAIGERLKAQRPAWEAIHKAGGKVFVAGYKGNNFEAVGDIQDLFVCASYPYKEEAEKWHSVGHKIFCYDNPQAGPENPEVWRRNFGLLLWKNNYDGAATFAYQHSSGNIWNDFDHPVEREYTFTYPTINGVIDTIALEGYREGIDDIRYATTLKLEIEKAKKSKNRKMRKVAVEVEKYLETLDVDRNLDTIRSEMINYILKLGGR